MRIKPMLGDWEVPRLSSIRSLERRAMVELPVPGRVGSLWQDLSSEPLTLALEGSLLGDDTRDEFLANLRSKFSEGSPLTFVADILTATDLQFVVIESMELAERGTRPDQIDYRIVLRESPPPPPPPDPLGGLDAGLLDQAASFVDSATAALDAIDSLVQLATSGLPDFSDPTVPLTGALDAIQAATSDLDALASDLKNLLG